jgi:lactate racemase
MKVDMKYGNTTLAADVDDRNILEVIEGNPDTCDKSESEILDYALMYPTDSARLSQLVRPGQKICIVIPDITRSWQRTDRYLYKVVDELSAGGIRDSDIVFLCGTGTHRKHTVEEHRCLLGEKLSSRFTVIDHDCLDDDMNVYIGTTSFGTPVRLNRHALECDHVVITGAIVYHFLPGWSGGKKSIVPGIASYDTIMANHALSLNPEFGAGIAPTVRSANIINNPVHQDMMEAASFLRPLFLFNVVMGHNGKIAGAVAGNYITAHEQGRKIVDRLDSVKIKGQSDLVIATAGGYPKDINLYQAIKVLINAREAARKGGTLIILAECSEGIGGDEGLVEILTGFCDITERERYLRKAYSITKFVGYFFCSTAQDYTLILVTSLDPAIFKTTGVIAVNTLDEAMKIAKSKCGNSYTTNLMPHGANTYPVIER